MSNPNELIDDLADVNLVIDAINEANDGITISDMTLEDQPLIFINKAFEIMTGYDKADVIGTNCRFLQGKLHNQPGVEVIHNAIQNRESCRVVLSNFKKDGSLFYNELSLAPVIDEKGNLHYYVGVQKDITKEIVQKERIAYLAMHDDLTGLLNYRGFFAKIDDLILKTMAHGAMIGIGVVDINFFKKINDEYGHVVGNNVLKLLGSELSLAFSKEDLVARFGGDEFFFAMMTTHENNDDFQDKIMKVTKAVNFLLSNTFQISLSAGFVCEKATKGTRLDQLIHRADNVMYENKRIAHLEALKNRNEK